MGDFNAYEKEDPIRVLEAAGYLSQGALTGEYSYAFGGAVGSLDGIYASPSAATAITGQDIWMINANESVALEYSRHNYVAEDLYSADQWRSSDHNPILVGLQLDAPVTEPTPEPEPSPGETCDGVTDPRGVPGKPANSVREWLRCVGATPGHGGDHPGKGHGPEHPGKGRGPVRP